MRVSPGSSIVHVLPVAVLQYKQAFLVERAATDYSGGALPLLCWVVFTALLLLNSRQLEKNVLYGNTKCLSLGKQLQRA